MPAKRHTLKTVMERVFITIAALHRKDGITVTELAGLMATQNNNAWRYLQEASRLLPVFEAGKRPSRTKPSVIYKFLED
jgi:hypothetical protein